MVIHVKSIYSLEKARCSSKGDAPATSLQRQKQGFGVPIHMKVQLVLVNVPFTAILNIIIPYWYEGVNYIALAVIPSWALPIAADSLHVAAGSGR